MLTTLFSAIVHTTLGLTLVTATVDITTKVVTTVASVI